MNSPSEACKRCLTLEVRGISSLYSEEFYHLLLGSPGWNWRPGQFLMLRPQKWSLDPFGARPFSIADDDGKNLHIYFQVVGRGTRKLSGIQKQETLTVWGPLGNGFDYDPELPCLLLAGGMGIVPFLGLVEQSPCKQNLELLFGHRKELDNYPYSRIAEKIWAEHIRDVSRQDLVRLEQELQKKIRDYSGYGQILTCGPRPFLKLVQEISRVHRATIQVSLETRMLCGIGACLGCTVQNKNMKNIPVCSQGPVFNIQDIVL